MVNHICHCLDYILQRYPHIGIILFCDFTHLPERYIKTHYRQKQIVIGRTLCIRSIPIWTNVMDSHTPVALSEVQITKSPFVNHSLVDNSSLDIDK